MVEIILTDGLNLVAIVVEAGIEVVNYAMNGVIEFAKLRTFRDL